MLMTNKNSWNQKDEKRSHPGCHAFILSAIILFSMEKEIFGDDKFLLYLRVIIAEFIERHKLNSKIKTMKIFIL